MTACKLVPVVPTEDQWGGLARAIMMWLDMSSPQPTPRKLFEHLERTGEAIPDWLRDEAEMQHLDHVPSKGTRCAIIYRAMIAAAPPDLGEGPREQVLRVLEPLAAHPRAKGTIHPDAGMAMVDANCLRAIRSLVSDLAGEK